MAHRRLKIAIVGCGDVAHRYAESIARIATVELVGATSRTRASAEAFASRHGGRVYADLAEALADPEIDAVVNLTTQSAHAAITTASLGAGKHVYSEKPLAPTASEARSLVALAERRGVLLACAPSTFLAPPQQQVIELVRAGALGKVRAAYAEVNWSRIESWHPRPEPFYEIGPLADVGPYPIALLVAALGPVARVEAFGRILLADRVTRDGASFAVRAPDFVVALLEFCDGAVARITANFYVARGSRQRGLELHGDDASLRLDTWFEGDGRIELVPLVGEPERFPPTSGSFAGVDWALGVVDLAEAVSSGRVPRASGELGAHVTEVVAAIGRAIREGGAVDVSDA